MTLPKRPISEWLQYLQLVMLTCGIVYTFGVQEQRLKTLEAMQQDREAYIERRFAELERKDVVAEKLNNIMIQVDTLKTDMVILHKGQRSIMEKLLIPD